MFLSIKYDDALTFILSLYNPNKATSITKPRKTSKEKTN